MCIIHQVAYCCPAADFYAFLRGVTCKFPHCTRSSGLMGKSGKDEARREFPAGFMNCRCSIRKTG